MIRGMLGASTVQGLREELDASIVRSREIAHRVANASNQSTASFESALGDAISNDTVDLEVEMVKLADEQIRFEASSRLLSKVYGQIRASMRST